MSDSNEGWSDSADGPGRILSEGGAALSAAKSAFPAWDVEQVAESTQTAEESTVTTSLPGQSAIQPPAEPPSRRRPYLVYGIIGLMLLAGVGAAGYWFGTRDASDTVASETPDATADEVDPAAPATGDDADTADAAGSDGAESDGSGSDGTTADDAVGIEVDESSPDYVAPEVASDVEFGFESEGVDALGRPVPVLPEELYPNTENAGALPYYAEEPLDAPTDGPYTVIKNGFFFLRGSLASENFRQELILRNLAILSPEQMVVEYELNPDSSWYFSDPLPVFLLDKLLFDVGSTEVNPDFLALFQIGANLVNIDPDISITVIGHTDSEGDDDFNLELSQGRVDAVKAVYVELGGNPDQIIPIAKGETEPIADNSTEEGRALNRRVEFVIGSLKAAAAEDG